MKRLSKQETQTNDFLDSPYIKERKKILDSLIDFWEYKNWDVDKLKSMNNDQLNQIFKNYKNTQEYMYVSNKDEYKKMIENENNSPEVNEDYIIIDED